MADETNPTDETDERAVVERALERLKIFPLPSSVLIPGGHLPFHLFEPRYREMIEHSLAEDRVLAIALLARGWEEDYHGRPPVEPVIGVGYVREEEELPDGRHNILLHGVLRARIVEELAARHPYREVRATPIADRDTSADLGPECLRIKQLVLDLVAALPHEAVSSLAKACARADQPGLVADLVGSATLTEASDRQRFLEQLDVAERLEIATSRLAELLLESVERPPDDGLAS